MTVTSIDNIFDVMEEFERQIKEDKEKKFAEIIQKYDFMVGSIELKMKLAEGLPKDANIVYSPLIDNPTMIYAIKKFDILDYILNGESEG